MVLYMRAGNGHSLPRPRPIPAKDIAAVAEYLKNCGWGAEPVEMPAGMQTPKKAETMSGWETWRITRIATPKSPGRAARNRLEAIIYCKTVPADSWWDSYIHAPKVK